MITSDIVQRLPSGNILLLPDDYNPNEFVGCDICVRITHYAGFVHYVPMHEVTHPRNYVL